MNIIKKLSDSNTTDKEVDPVLKDLITQKFEAEFKSSFQKKYSAQKEKSKTKGKTKIINRRLIIIAAVAACSIFLIIFSPGSNHQSSPHQDAVRLLNDSELLHPGTSKGSNGDLHRNDAIKNFNMANYQLAIDHFELINPLTSEDQLFLGIAHLHSGQISRALARLNTARQNNRYQEESTYFIGLAQILENNHRAAIETLNSIAPHQYKYGTSQELLKKLEQ